MWTEAVCLRESLLNNMAVQKEKMKNFRKKRHQRREKGGRERKRRQRDERGEKERR